MLVRIDAVVNGERVGWERTRFEELARKHGGGYDGWRLPSEPLVLELDERFGMLVSPPADDGFDATDWTAAGGPH